MVSLFLLGVVIFELGLWVCHLFFHDLEGFSIYCYFNRKWFNTFLLLFLKFIFVLDFRPLSYNMLQCHFFWSTLFRVSHFCLSKSLKHLRIFFNYLSVLVVLMPVFFPSKESVICISICWVVSHMFYCHLFSYSFFFLFF